MSQSLGPRWEGNFQEGEDCGQINPRTAAQMVTHMIPLFWAIGVQDRADRV